MSTKSNPVAPVAGQGQQANTPRFANVPTKPLSLRMDDSLPGQPANTPRFANEPKPIVTFTKAPGKLSKNLVDLVKK
ncbi:hypothetical protein OC846_006235 [Tilletia horrida]|uniref:Uncharacterized protein n=1 Tax=Tilletia horrida TaxID=155126 RepID=A0AAN6JPI6_9BASI|nr:hypothetical protein OC846_006235 [Tilletia horrida]